MSMREAMREAGIEVPDEPERRDTSSMSTQQQRPRGQDRGGQRDRRAQRGGGSQQNNLPMPTFPKSYFLPDEKKPCLNTAFVSKKTVDPLAQGLADAHPRLTTGQIRRFFNHCRELERKLKVDGESWPRVAADFEALSAHAQYACPGRNNKIPVEFRQFIDDNVDRVTAAEDPRTAFLEGFLPHFEALVGFGAAHMRDN